MVTCGPAVAAEDAARRKAAQQALFAACMTGDERTAKALLEGGDVGANEIVHALGKAPPLSVAVEHPKLMRLLVEGYGARVDARRGDGSTALADAAERGLLESLFLLCDEYGADPNIEDADGNTALDHARREKRTDAAEALKARGGLRGRKKPRESAKATFDAAARAARVTTDAASPLAGFDLDNVTELDAHWGRPPPPLSDLPPVRRCARCDRAWNHDKKLARCSRCKVAVYCDRDCQKAHWPQHRDGCRTKPAAKPA